MYINGWCDGWWAATQHSQGETEMNAVQAFEVISDAFLRGDYEIAMDVLQDVHTNNLVSLNTQVLMALLLSEEWEKQISFDEAGMLNYRGERWFDYSTISIIFCKGEEILHLQINLNSNKQGYDTEDRINVFCI